MTTEPQEQKNKKSKRNSFLQIHKRISTITYRWILNIVKKKAIPSNSYSLLQPTRWLPQYIGGGKRLASHPPFLFGTAAFRLVIRCTRKSHHRVQRLPEIRKQPVHNLPINQPINQSTHRTTAYTSIPYRFESFAREVHPAGGVRTHVVVVLDTVSQQQ